MERRIIKGLGLPSKDLHLNKYIDGYICQMLYRSQDTLYYQNIILLT